LFGFGSSTWRKAVSFLLLGAVVALNAGFGQKYYDRATTPWGLHAEVFIAAWVLLLIWAHRREKRK
jgi:hypothetical protein